MKKTITWTCCLLALGFILAVGGCKRATTGTSIVTANLPGREVKATVEGGAWISPQGDSATVSIPGHKITVEKERLLLDGKEQAKIPAAASKIEIVYAAGKLTVTADGAEVFSDSLQK